MRHAHRCETRFLDELQVPAAALDVQDLFVFADEIDLAQLDRGVAAAMQYERRVSSEQARGVNTLRQVALESGGLGVVPKALHACEFRAWRSISKHPFSPRRERDGVRAIIADGTTTPRGQSRAAGVT